MNRKVYRVWTVAAALIFFAGILLFAAHGADIVSFVAGAGIAAANVLLLGKGVAALFGYTGKKAVYLFLLVLKYAFLLTTLYIAMVIVKVNPVPFVSGITVLPLSSMAMAVFMMVRRDDDA